MKLDLLLCSYGIDSALSQILYYHHTGKTNFMTLGKKAAVGDLGFLESYTPSILINFNVNEDFFYPDTAPITFNKTHSLSATNQLATYLNVDKSIMKYAVLSDRLLQYDEELESVYNYYEAIGHENFVNRFITTDSLTLTKSEIALGKATIIENQKIAKEYVDNFLFYKDGIAIIRSNFKLGRYLEEMIIDKYAEDGLKLVCTYSYNGIGSALRFKAKKDLKEKLLQNIDSTYIDEDSIVISITNEPLEENFYDILSEAWDKMVEEDKKKVFDEYDKQIKETNIDLDNIF